MNIRRETYLRACSGSRSTADGCGSDGAANDATETAAKVLTDGLRDTPEARGYLALSRHQRFRLLKRRQWHQRRGQRRLPQRLLLHLLRVQEEKAV